MLLVPGLLFYQQHSGHHLWRHHVWRQPVGSGLHHGGGPGGGNRCGRFPGPVFVGDLTGSGALVQYGLLMQCLACFVGSTGFCMLLNLHGSGMFLCIVGGIFSLLSYRLFCYLGCLTSPRSFLRRLRFPCILRLWPGFGNTLPLRIFWWPSFPWSPVRTSITPWITPSGATPMRSFGTAFTLALWLVPWRLAFSWSLRPSACGASGGTGRKWANYLSIIRRREGWPLWPPFPAHAYGFKTAVLPKNRTARSVRVWHFHACFPSRSLNCLYNCCNILLVIFREEVFGDDGQ